MGICDSGIQGFLDPGIEDFSYLRILESGVSVNLGFGDFGILRLKDFGILLFGDYGVWEFFDFKIWVI